MVGIVAACDLRHNGGVRGRQRGCYVALEMGRDARVAPDEFAERSLVCPSTHDHESAYVDGLGLQASRHPRFTRGPDGPDDPPDPLGLGANGDREPVADVYHARSRAEYVDRNLGLPLLRQPGDAALKPTTSTGSPRR